MNIDNLKISTKPVRIRKFYKETKSKIIIDVGWSWLKGNAQPYLSVSIVSVKLNGEAVDFWQDQKTAIKTLDETLYNLVSLHLVSFDGLEMHEISNMAYYFKQCRNTLGRKIYTLEEHNEKLASLKNLLHNFELLGAVQGNVRKYFLEYLDENSDHFKYFDKWTTVEHWKNQNLSIRGGGIFNYKKHE